MLQTRHQLKMARVRRVLLGTLVANWSVALAKLLVGFVSGTMSLIADGFHSVLDGSSNIIGLISIKAAAKPADTRYPYGRRKYETFAAVGICMLLVLSCYEIVKEAVRRFWTGSAPEVGPLSFVVIVSSMVINHLVATYERRRGEELKSAVLVADAHHTHSDVYGSLAVLLSLVAIRLGYPLFDVFAALFIVGLIGRAIWHILSESLHTLMDISRLPAEEIEAIALSVPGVRECHNIRSRGLEDAVYIDLHIGVDPHLPIEEAHNIGCEVERRLLSTLEGVTDVVVHTEPARSLHQVVPDEALRRSVSTRAGTESRSSAPPDPCHP
ncbi:MAG: cation transporter [Candidatus Tectimicrobiota bacterium]|nr:MAG: cation transporter [Candidatus Tectomicrobia bacterium]